MVMKPVDENNPTRMLVRRKSVMFKSDLLPSKLLNFFPIFPQSLLTSTPLFLSSLRGITYACSITCPSGKPIATFYRAQRYGSSLLSKDKFCRYLMILTSLATKTTRSFSILESLKRYIKETPAVLFRHLIP